MPNLLLDENLPKKLKYRFGESFDVTTVLERGWSSLRNGDLLKAMNQAGIEYLVTADKNLNLYFTATARSSAARFTRTSVRASEC